MNNPNYDDVDDVEAVDESTHLRINQTNHVRTTDDIFEEIGEFGSYQAFIFIIVSFISIIPSLTAYSYVFNGGIPEHRCKLPNYPNDTFEIQSEYHRKLIDYYIPKPEPNVDINNRYDGCHIKVYNSSLTAYFNGVPFNHLANCDEWVYSKEYYETTVVTKWNLVCSKKTIRSLFSTLYFSGYFAVLVIGLLADRFGRKKIAYIFVVINAVSNVLLAIVMEIDDMDVTLQQVLYGLLRLCVGISANIYAVAMVCAIEIVGPTYRVTAANSVYYFFILGEFMAIILCYYIRVLEASYNTVAAISTIFCFYFWIVPESPRYLITQKRAQEAFKIFFRIAKSNKREIKRISPEDIVRMNDQTKEGAGFLKSIKILLQSRKMCIITIINLINWLAITLVYDGLSFNIALLAGNPYLNALFSAAAELGGIGASHIAYSYIGRKLPYMINIFIAAISLVAVSFVSIESSIVIRTLALVGKFAVSFTFNGVYIVTAELYPTTIRNTALSVCLAFSRFGGVIAPYCQLLSVYWYPLPFLIYGVSVLMAGLSFLVYMPETKALRMYDTIEDMENNEKEK